MKNIKFFIVIGLLCLLSTGCFEEKRERKMVTKRAIDYFTTKYNIDKSKLKIAYNSLYGKNENCWLSCGENDATIEYNGKNYKIQYDREKDLFADDYQYDKISKDFNAYLNNLFPFVSSIEIERLNSDVLSTPEKYNGNIRNYIVQVKKNSENNSCHMSIIIWIESSNSNEAKELNNKYKKELIKELNELDLSYKISFSNRKGSNEYSSFYYYDFIDGGRKPAFMYWDRVDDINNNYLKCYDKSIIFNDDEMICKN